MRIHIIAHGRVQGVGFRFSAQQKAVEYNLTGYVRNLANGDVELEVEGEKSKVKDFIEEIESGLNPFIRIDHLKVTRFERKKGYSEFSIEY